MKTASTLMLLVAGGCSPRSAPINCSHPPDSFGTWRTLKGGIDGFQVNTIRIGPGGELYWNGARLGRNNDPSGHDLLDQYVSIVPRLTPSPSTTIVFRKGAPCASVTRVRALMEARLACSRSPGTCLQGEVPGEQY